MNRSVDFKHISIYQTPEESPGYLLWWISTQWRSSIENVLKPLNLTHPQFVVLASLGWMTRNGAKVSQVDVGRTAGLDPNTTSQILRGLETKKFIKRTRSTDERTKNPMVTALGSEILAQALPAVEKADEQFFSILSSKQMQDLLMLFQKLVAT